MLETSYRASYRIAVAEEAHGVAETLFKLCAVANCVLGELSIKKLAIFRLSSYMLNVAFKICPRVLKDNYCRFFVATGLIDRQIRASSSTYICTSLVQ